jgi:hypothetical protein
MKGEPVPVKAVEQRRAAMPAVAAFIDMCRAAYGASFVDQQMATAQHARRDYTKVLAEQGPVAAKRWLQANDHRCTFFASEAGRELGLRSAFGNDL